jgi:hypothetical protein
MFVETIVPREDLVSLIESALPLVVHFEGGGSLDVFGLSEVSIVPDEGLRVACKAKVRWPALGIPLHVTLHSVTLMLRPKIEKVGDAEAMRLEASIEHADFAGLPDFADEALRKRIDEALRARKQAFAWDFMAMLRRRVAIPENVSPLSTLTIEAAWGKLRITEEAIVFVMSIHTSIARGELPAIDRPQPSRAMARPAVQSSALYLAGFGFIAGALLATAIVLPSRGY